MGVIISFYGALMVAYAETVWSMVFVVLSAGAFGKSEGVITGSALPAESKEVRLHLVKGL